MSTPSLLLVPDLIKAGKLYSQIPADGTGDFTVTRATTAYRTNANGILESVANNVPRLDYPASGGCPALLVEPAATNLLLRSEEFDNASWTKTTVTVNANTSISPDGASTADTINDNISLVDATYALNQSVSWVSGTTYTASVYAKNISRRYIYIRFVNTAFTNNLFVYFDLQNGVVVSQSAGVVGSISLSENGFYRCTARATATATTTANLVIGLSINGITNAYVNTTSSSVLFWGAQLETGSVATSYIPTVATTQTRNADVISKTGASALIGQTEGWLYAEVDTRITGGSVAKRILSISDGTINNRIEIIKRATDAIEGLVSFSGINTASIVTAISQSGIFKIAIAYAVNDIVMFVNGSQIGVDTSTNVPACSQIFLGNALGGTQFNDRIRAAAIGTTRISNAELSALTTL